MKYDVNYIAEQCGVKRGSIVSYVKYCAETGRNTTTNSLPI